MDIYQRLKERIDRLVEENIALKNRVNRLENSLQVRESTGSLSLAAAANVAIVEDDKDVQDFLNEFLTEQGFNTIICDNGADLAFQIFKGRKIDLITLDLKMPKIDGWEILESLNTLASLAKIPIIVFSGFIDANAEEFLKERGITYFSKPVDLATLEKVVKSHLSAIHRTGSLP